MHKQIASENPTCCWEAHLVYALPNGAFSGGQFQPLALWDEWPPNPFKNMVTITVNEHTVLVVLTQAVQPQCPKLTLHCMDSNKVIVIFCSSYTYTYLLDNTGICYKVLPNTTTKAM